MKAFTAAKVDEKFCIKLMCQYSRSIEIGNLFRDVLSHYVSSDPCELKFDFPDHIACPTQLCQILQKVPRRGKSDLILRLPHSYHNYVPCDDVIEALNDAR